MVPLPHRTWKIRQKKLYLASGSKKRTGRKIISLLQPFISKIEEYAKLNYFSTYKLLKCLDIPDDQRVGIWPQATFLYNVPSLRKHRDRNNYPGLQQFTLVFGNFSGGELEFTKNNTIVEYNSRPTLVIFNAKEMEHKVHNSEGWRFSLQLFLHNSVHKSVSRNKL